MIHVDVLGQGPESARRIQIRGEYKTVAYEIAKVLSAYMITYIGTDHEQEINAMYQIIYAMSVGMMEDTEKQMRQTSMVSVVNSQVLKDLLDMLKDNQTPEEKLFHAIFDNIDDDREDEEDEE